MEFASSRTSFGYGTVDAAAMRIYQQSTLVKIFYTIYVGIIHTFEAELRSESMTYFKPSGPIFAPIEF